jgi:hypothetical protein
VNIRVTTWGKLGDEPETIVLWRYLWNVIVEKDYTQPQAINCSNCGAPVTSLLGRCVFCRCVIVARPQCTIADINPV